MSEDTSHRSILGSRASGSTVAGESPERRFGERVAPLPNGCWAYNGNLTAYGSFTLSKRNGMARESIAAHRFAYETLVGPIPDGHHLHHECENPGCVNPAHLVALTPADHSARHAEMRRTG